jgi:hypothetical protein
MEDNLLSVGQQLSVPREVTHDRNLSRHLDPKQNDWHDHKWVHSSEETEAEAESRVVSDLTHNNVASFIGFVQMNAVFVSENTGKSAMVICIATLATENCTKLPND